MVLAPGIRQSCGQTTCMYIIIYMYIIPDPGFYDLSKLSFVFCPFKGVCQSQYRLVSQIDPQQ